MLLSPREIDVVRLLADDYTQVEIAGALGVSRHTVRHYIERAKLKLRVFTLPGLVCAAIQAGYVVRFDHMTSVPD